MGFKDLKKEELVAAADYFGSDSDGTKDEVIEQLEDDGVTWEMYEQHVADSEPEPAEPPADVSDKTDVEPVTPDTSDTDEPAAPDDRVLVKMVTSNAIYERVGVRFTRAHPYRLVSKRQADVILQSEDFREATPEEAREYYS